MHFRKSLLANVVSLTTLTLASPRQAPAERNALAPPPEST